MKIDIHESFGILIINLTTISYSFRYQILFIADSEFANSDTGYVPFTVPINVIRDTHLDLIMKTAIQTHSLLFTCSCLRAFLLPDSMMLSRFEKLLPDFNIPT